MSTKRTGTRIWPCILVGGALLVGGLGGVFGASVFFPESKPPVLTTPIPEALNNRSLTLGGRVALEGKLRALASDSVAKGKISDYSIYYQEFVSGPVIAIQENHGFFPASLLKLPVALWYFDKAQEDPTFLSNEIVFNGPKGVSITHFPPARSVEAGETYTLEELIELMLAESDNDATSILVEYAGGREAINEVYRELDIQDVENYDTYAIDTQTYGAFFRVLFNSRYLDRTSSERILKMLTRTSFKAGIVAGLPEGVVVAHKFGERTIDPAGPVEQLHNCGIVYAPANPYLLCMMTQGDTYEEMAAFLAEASHLIYEAASTVRP